MCSVSAPCAVGHESACEQCGEGFSRRTHHGKKQRFCGLQCSNRAQADAADARNARACETCGKTFRRRNPNAATARDAGKYCSKKCYGAARAAARAAQRIATGATLVDWFEGWHAQHVRAARGKAAHSRIAGRLAAKVCGQCGNSNPKPHSRFCSSECRRIARRKQIAGPHSVLVSVSPGRLSRWDKSRQQALGHSKNGWHLSRCKEAGLPFDAGVTFEFVRERDKGRCRQCGVKTLPAYTTKYHPLFGRVEVDPRSPTVDHIVPLRHKDNDKHGHTANNTQLLCHACNSKKSGTVTIDGVLQSDNPRRLMLLHLKTASVVRYGGGVSSLDVG